MKFTASIFFIAFTLADICLSGAKGPQILRSEGMMGRLEVLKEKRNDEEILLLKVNNIIQSEMEVQSRASISEYVKLLDHMIPESAKPRNALVLGLGGGLTSNLLVEKKYRVTGVEFDQRIIDAARKYFFLDHNVECVCEDARYYMNNCDKKFGLVLFDVFKAEEQPDHVLTVEGLERLKKNLDNDAVVYVNWHGYGSGDEGMGTSVLYNTLEKAGFKVAVNSFSDDEAHRNIVFLASLNPDFVMKKNNEFASQYASRSYPAIISGKKDPEINTDDRPVLEKYNAPANKAWRSNYLRYYQSAR